MSDDNRDKLEIRHVDFFYSSKHVLRDISLAIPEHQITSVIGPSGCGKTTLLRVLNRLHEHIPGARLTGDVLLDGQSIYRPGISVTKLRRQIGMVFQKPNPFPMSIFDNVAYGLRISGRQGERAIQESVKCALEAVGIWDELRNELTKSGRQLSEGQQQRVCIARALAVSPDVLLLDEPCSALDPASTEAIEELLLRLKSHCTIVIVTHSLGQTRRISDWIAFLLYGQLIEFGSLERMVSAPNDARTFDYLNGRFG